MASSSSSRALIPFLVAAMLLTGVSNTIITKYQDMQCVRNCEPNLDPGSRRNFEQPVWQTAQMFVGEMGCGLFIVLGKIYQRAKKRSGTRVIAYEPISADDHQTRVYQDRTDGPSIDTSGLEARAGTLEALQDESGETTIHKIMDPIRPELRPLTGLNIFLLALPAICDIIGTTFMNIGLLFVAASIYQMTRGALVLFVGLFSVLFLGHHLAPFKWFALVVVVAGVAVVGLAGAIEQQDAQLPPRNGDSAFSRIGDLTVKAIARTLHELDKKATDHKLSIAASPTPVGQTLFGIFLIALAQIFTASQFVLEESIMHRYSMTPLVTVAWEGTFGLFFTSVGILLAHLMYGSTPAGKDGYFDAVNGWRELTSNKAVLISSFLIMISIGGFNFFGLSVTRNVSATSRSTIDTCRTLFIWIISLGLGWETFKWLQVVGFAWLVYGTFLFNGIVKPPKWLLRRQTEESEEATRT